MPILDEALSDWIIKHIPYNLIEVLFLAQETVPETRLPNSTDLTEFSDLPLCKVLELTNESYDVTRGRRPKHKMCMVGHQTVGVYWCFSFVRVPTQHVACRLCEPRIYKEWTSRKRANSHGADRS